jgi:hypothetical protein
MRHSRALTVVSAAILLIRAAADFAPQNQLNFGIL